MIGVKRRDLPLDLIRIGLVLWALFVFFESINPIFLYIVIPCIFIYCFLHYNIFNKNRYFRLYMWLMIWIAMTCFSSYYLNLSLKEMKSDMPVVMMCYICCCLAEDYKNLKFLYSIWIFLLIGIFLYAFESGLLTSMDIQETRLNDHELNANMVAYAAFYTTFSLYMLGELMTNKKLYRGLFFLMIPISFVIALLTASRQVLLIQIPLFFLLLTIRYVNILNHAKTIIFGLCFLTAIGYYATDKVVDIYENSLLAKRAQKDLKKDSRTKLLKDAFNVGMKHPVTGVGPSNYIEFSYNHHFSHCTYTELFACSGIPAVLFYLLLLGTFIKKQISYFMETKNKLFLTFLTFGVVYIFYNFFYVFFSTIYLIPYFLIVGSQSDMLYYKTRNEEFL